jgi:signal transduction histidine kinase
MKGSSERDRRGDPIGGAPPSAFVEVLKFAAAALVVLAVLAVGAALILRNVSEDEAIEQAERVTEVVARGPVEAAVDRGLVTGNPRSRARVDRIVREQILGSEVVRVKIWTADGEIVYSDEPRLVGTRYELDADELEAMDTGIGDAELSDLEEPENRFDRGHGELLEVYLPIDAGGTPLLFETYQPFSSITASGSDLLGEFAPALIGAIVVLALLLLPLAWSLARRLQREHAGREALLRRALDSSELERRRIAADLHDGILQDLTGAAFAISAVGERLPADDTGFRPRVEQAAATCRSAVRKLRSLLVEIYPARLREAGLESALADLLAPFKERGTAVSLSVSPELPSGDAEALLFRVAQEALRNVAEHADATAVEVRAEVANELATLTVRDNGRGFSTEEELARRREGHMGVRLLQDLARDSGGTVDVESRVGEGTVVRVEVPLR